jgi:hypothetical protein
VADQVATQTAPEPETRAAPQEGSRIKRIVLATLMAIVAVNIWTGSPLFAVWVGSKVQGDGPPKMGALVAVIAVLGALSFLLYQLMQRIGRAYDKAAGIRPGARTHAPWMRSMRDDEKRDPSVRPVSAIELIVVISVIFAVIAFEIWFFFFAGAPF